MESTSWGKARKIQGILISISPIKLNASREIFYTLFWLPAWKRNCRAAIDRMLSLLLTDLLCQYIFIYMKDSFISSKNRMALISDMKRRWSLLHLSLSAIDDEWKEHWPGAISLCTYQVLSNGTLVYFSIERFNLN